MEESPIDQLIKVVSEYIDHYVYKPSTETIKKDFYAQDHIIDILMVVDFLIESAVKEGSDIDKDFLRGLSKDEIKKRLDVLSKYSATQETDDLLEFKSDEEAQNYLFEDSSRKYLLPYLYREINWITISVLSASYISSMILMRAVFELIIGIASKDTGSMKDRINSISIFSEEEKVEIKNLWDRLCAWGHPYGKWIKEICPGYVAHAPIYHPVLCELCLKELDKIVDVLSVVVFAKYEIDITKLSVLAKKFHINLNGFELLEKRLNA